MDKKTALVILNMIDGIRPVNFRKLLEIFKDPVEILSADEKFLENKIPAQIIKKLKNWRDILWEKELDRVNKMGIKIITYDDADYPENLKQIPDPPIVLYVKGHIPSEKIFIAVVGTRNPSFYGASMAEKFASILASFGLCIVSGLARGIDSIAHKSALTFKSSTVAVLGSGLANIYPPENEKLAESITENGALISEFPLDTMPERFNFPRRNRIISGISRAVVVIEAGLRSGALITAHLAADQNKDVFVLPSDAGRITGRGNNQLIKEGAILVESPEEILEHMNLEIQAPDSTQKQNFSDTPVLTDLEKLVYNVIRGKTMHFEQIQMESGKSVQELTQALTGLEIKGLVKSEPGSLWHGIVKHFQGE